MTTAEKFKLVLSALDRVPTDPEKRSILFDTVGPNVILVRKLYDHLITLPEVGPMTAVEILWSIYVAIEIELAD